MSDKFDVLMWCSDDGLSRDFDYPEACEAMAGPDQMVQSVRDGVPMQLNIATDDIVNMNIKTLNLKEVTNPSNFESGNIPTVGGLFSEVIFGSTQEERRKTWGYINLNTKLIHPYIYEVLTRLQQNIEKVCSGEGAWKIDSKGKLVEAKPGDPDYNPDNTGIDWFIEVYPKIVFPRNKSLERNERLDLLETFAPGEIFITKWLVMPVFFRDVETRDGPPKVPEINNLYRDLIRYSQSIKQESIMYVSNMAKYNMQKTLVSIRKYFQTLIEKSDGFFHQYVVGKNPDYGARSVISCAVLDQYDKPDDDPIDMNHTGIPLSQVCIMLFPYIRRWVHNFLENNLSIDCHLVPYREKVGDEIVVKPKELDDPMSVYTQDYIKKRIDKWIDNYESRFDPVMVPLKDGTEKALVFRGRPFANDPDNPQAATISKRPMTWTDLLYMAAVDVSADKVVWTTRYPVVGHLSTFPSMIHVLSTIKTMPVMIDGTVYKYYPVIDPSLPKNVVAVSFNDTVTMSNMYLSAINGDYDGDTVSMRVPFLVESNEESVGIINSLKQYLNAQGNLVRNVKNESYLMLYNLTKPDSTAGNADDIIKGKFLAMKHEDIGVKKLAELFGTNYNANTKKIEDPKYKTGMKLHLNAGEYINKEAVDTTLGIFMFNKILVEPYISKVIPNGYYNEVLTSKKAKALFNIVGNAAMYGRISPEELWPFLRAFEFYTTKSVTIFCPSYTSNILIPKKELLDQKDKFFKENNNPSLAEMEELENNLTDQASKMLENDPGYPLFASDARGSVADNYKVMSVMVGPVLNPATGEWERIESDYISGIKKNELTQAGNMVINGVYPKACGTADSGYITKQFNAVFESLRVDEDGTDCGTKSYVLVKLTPQNWKGFELQNIYDGDKQVVLDETNYQKFLGKIVKMRSPMCCTSANICSGCAGRRPYVLNMPNIGLQLNNMPNTFLELSMKKFHVSKVETDDVDVNKLLI